MVERIRTSGRVLLAFGVGTERSITVGRVVAAGGVVCERINASGTVKRSAGVAKERINTRGSVEAAIGIAKQSPKTGRRILVAVSEVVKHLEPSARVPDTGGATHQRASTFAIVGAWYGSVRVGTYSLRCW